MHLVCYTPFLLLYAARDIQVQVEMDAVERIIINPRHQSPTISLNERSIAVYLLPTTLHIREITDRASVKLRRPTISEPGIL